MVLQGAEVLLKGITNAVEKAVEKQEQKRPVPEFNRWWEKSEPIQESFEPYAVWREDQPLIQFRHHNPRKASYLYPEGEIENQVEACTEAFNFLEKFDRLTREQPTPQELLSVFTLSVRRLENTVQVSEPEAFPPPATFAYQLQYEEIEAAFGDIDKGIKRIERYLTAFYRQHGDIRNSLPAKDFIENDQGGPPVPILNLKIVELWESAQQEKPAGKRG